MHSYINMNHQKRQVITTKNTFRFAKKDTCRVSFNFHQSEFFPSHAWNWSLTSASNWLYPGLCRVLGLSFSPSLCSMYTDTQRKKMWTLYTTLYGLWSWLNASVTSSWAIVYAMFHRTLFLESLKCNNYIESNMKVLALQVYTIIV